jgi:hypothetical protein
MNRQRQHNANTKTIINRNESLQKMVSANRQQIAVDTFNKLIYPINFNKMACHFTITFQGSAGDFLAKAKVEKNNGTFDGDTSSCTFYVPTPLGHVSGDYSIAGHEIAINIIQKPIIVRCVGIRNYINGHL